MSGHAFRVRVEGTTFFCAPAYLTVNSPDTIFVNVAATGNNTGTSWINAFTNLQDAIQIATGCNEIWVAKGTYHPKLSPNDRYSYEMRSGLRIYGGFFGNEPLLSLRNWTNNPTILLNHESEAIFLNEGFASRPIDASAALDGFFLQGTTRQLVRNFHASPTIRNCEFKATGGAAIFNISSAAQILDCIFRDGDSSQIENSDSAPLIENCVFVDNAAQFGAAAIDNSGSSPQIVDSTFLGNRGSAILISSESSVSISRCEFRENHSATGGAIGVDNSSGTEIHNTVFDSNTAEFYGGAIISSGSLNISHSTFVRNGAPIKGGAIYGQGAAVTRIENSILWDNLLSYHPLVRQDATVEHAQLGFTEETTNEVFYSCVQGLNTFTGNGNVGVEPLFASDSFQLLPFSPLINAGSTNGAIALQALDKIGNPRTSGDVPDIGAYEFQGAPSQSIAVLALPESKSFCREGAAEFSVVKVPGSPLDFQWQIWNGSAFVPVSTNGGTHQITSVGDTQRLILPQVGPAHNGNTYRVSLGAFSSPPVVLTVQMPHIVYVNAASPTNGDGSSWASAFTNLQQAMQAAGTCSEVWVAAGTYEVTPHRTQKYLSVSSGVRLYGGFEGTETNLSERSWETNPTIIVGRSDEPVFRHYGHFKVIDASAIVDGFTIRPGADQSGIVNYSASPIIRNCSFEDINRSGIRNLQGASPLIVNCVFRDIREHALYSVEGSSPRVENCLFENNNSTNTGSALYTSESEITVIDSSFIGNSSTAVHNSKSAGITFRQCVFTSNSGWTGGSVLNSYTSAAFENCLFDNNDSPGLGGALFNNESIVQMRNCTLTLNRAGISGGGIYQSGGTNQISNSILWDNRCESFFSVASAMQISLEQRGQLEIAGSCIQNWPVLDNGVIDSDPLFVNPLSRNFQLTPRSPAANAGVTNSVPVGELDLAGNPRLFGEVDMGAYELQEPASPPFVLSAQQVTATACLDGYAVYSVSGSEELDIQWQMSTGGEFEPIPANPAYVITATAGTSKFEIFPVTSAMNGYQFRFVDLESGYTSAATTLSVAGRDVIYVSGSATGLNNGSSWTNAFTNIQSAVDAAAGCSEIWVAEGVYTPGDGRHTFSMKSKVAIYGGFNGTETARNERDWVSNPTIIEGKANAYCVVGFGQSAVIDPGAILDGFVIRNAAPFLGVYNYRAEPTIQNCVFTGNAAAVVWNQKASPRILDCTFSNNTGVAILNQESSPFIRDSVFQSNKGTSSAGAIENYLSNLRIESSVFRDNSGVRSGAIYNGSGTTLFIDACSFLENSTDDDGGAICNRPGSSLVLRNSVLADNRSLGHGGGVFHLGQSLDVLHCTIVNNTAAFSGGGLYLGSGSVALKNSILWKNRITSPAEPLESSQVEPVGASNTVANCVLEGLDSWTGNGNIGADPLLRFNTPTDFALSQYSPAVNAGAVDANAGALDLLKQARVYGASSDIGAVELQEAALAPLRFASLPSSARVCEGQTVEFTVTLATNPPAGSFRWQRRAPGPTIDIQTNATYQITSDANGSTLTIHGATAVVAGTLGFVFEGPDYNYTSADVTLAVATSGVIYVDKNAGGSGDGTSWSNAITSVSQAIATAGPCSEIWVAQGTYTQTNGHGAGVSLQLRSGIQIFGGFIGTESMRHDRDWVTNATVLHAGPEAGIFDNNGFSQPVDASCIVDGFTLMGAGAGTVAFNNTMASPIIQNCVFQENHFALLNRYSSPRIIDCVFSNNVGGGATKNELSSPWFENVVFANNRNSNAMGGAVYNVSSSPSFIACSFTANHASSGGAAYIENSPAVTFERCRFLKNQGGDGGAILAFSSQVTLSSSLLAQNSAGNRGGAFFISEHSGIASRVDLTNCTVSANTAGYVGAGHYLYGGTLQAVNSIIWANRNVGYAANLNFEQAQVYLENSLGTVQLSYSCIEGLNVYAGNNNIATDPLFEGTASGPEYFQLDTSSPLIDAGLNLSYTPAALDLGGLPRVQAGAVDVGAYESLLLGTTPVQLTSLPHDQTICEGGTAVFSVTGTDGFGPTVSWRVNGGVLPDDGYHLVVTNSNTATLIVSNTPVSFSGNQYRVRVDNPGDFYMSREISLTVNPRGVVYVNVAMTGGANNGADWNNAFTNLQSALNIADGCSEIWVATGTYTVTPAEDGRRSFRLGPGWKLYGGFSGIETERSARNWSAHPTILRGTGSNPVVQNLSSDDVNSSAVLDGFVINGNGYHGMVNIASSPQVKNCRFEFCAGAALKCSDQSNPLIDSCTFQTNNGPALVIQNNSSPTITNSLFLRNTNLFGAGGALSVYNSSPIIKGSALRENQAFNGGAIEISGSSLVTVSDTLFDGNRAIGQGGAIANGNGSSLLIRNGVFQYNQAANGAALVNSGEMRLINSTVAANAAAVYGGGLLNSGGSSEILNSILWLNTSTYGDYYGINTSARQITIWAGNSVISNSCVEALSSSANGNIPYDPLFANIAAGDWHLTQYSPTVNSGNNAIAADITTDLDGNLRVVTSVVDMGAYEYQSGSFSSLNLFTLPQSATSCLNGTAAFSIVGTSTNIFQWFYSTNGSDWNTLNSGPFIAKILLSETITGLNKTSVVTVTNVTPEMHGTLFRAYLVGTTYNTPSAVLNVNPPQVIYVNAAAGPGGDGRSWNTAFGDLQSAIWAMDDCRRILWLAGGTYYPSTNAGTANSFQIQEQFEMYGGFSGSETNLAQRNWRNNPTILNGDFGATGEDASDAQLLMYLIGTTGSINSNSIVDGLIFERANAALQLSQASPTIQNCIIRMNRNGINGVNASPIIRDCEFTGNSGTNSTALFLSGDVTNVTTALIERCVFLGNSTHNRRSAAIASSQVSLQVINCLITGNIAESTGDPFASGGLSVSGGNSMVVNSTFAANRGNAEVSGGITVINSGSAEVLNSIVWGNVSGVASLEGQQIATVGISTSVTISNSTVQGLTSYASNSNIGYDPQFVSAISSSDAPSTNGVWTLRPCSPAVNTGNDVFASDTIDLAGQPRLFGPIDMGAYEFQSAAAPALSIAISSNVTFCGNQSNTFSVNATGSNLAYQWEMNRNDGNGFVALSNSGQFSGVTSATLQMHSATYTLNNAGVRCAVSTTDGCSAFSLTATLTVKPGRLFVNHAAAANGDGLSWNTALTNIQQALTSSHLDPCGTNEVWVAAGTYPSLIQYLKEGVALYGGFAGTETNLNHRNYTANPVYLEGTFFYPSTNFLSSATRVDGFVFQNGSTAIGNGLNDFSGNTNSLGAPVIANCIFKNFSSYGIQNYRSSPTISNCVFTNCFIAAVYNDRSSTASITDSLFLQNQWGVRNANASSATLEACRFEGNMRAVLHNFGGPTSGGFLTVTDSSFIGNGNAIYNRGQLNIDRSVFRGNTNCAVECVSSTVQINNSLFSGNDSSGGFGAGLYSDGPTTTIIRNCTFSDNKAVNSYGAAIYAEGTTRLFNSIIWGNTGVGSADNAQIYGNFFSETRNNCIENFGTSTFFLNYGAASGNVNTNPLFLASIASTNAPSIFGDYHLAAFSPVINLGNNADAGATTNDLDRMTRLFGNVDIGAYEYQGAPATIVPLEIALDTTNRIWTTGGAQAPLGQTSISHDGVDSAWLGFIGQGQETWMETSVVGPVTLEFWWKIEADAADSLQLIIDGVPWQSISGTNEWTLLSKFISSGTHSVRWRFSRGSAINSAPGVAWVDQVSVTYPTSIAYSVTSTNDSGTGSLRAAMTEAAQLPIPAVIDLSSVDGVVTLNSPLPLITSAMTINGPGTSQLTIDGQGLHRLFFVDASNQVVQINNLTLANGMARGGNGGERAGGGAGMGGAIFANAGHLITSNIVFSGNAAVGGDGGAGSGANSGGGGGGAGGHGGSPGNGAGGGGGFGGDGGNSSNWGGGGGGGFLARGGHATSWGGGGGGGLTDGGDTGSSSGGAAGIGGGTGASSESTPAEDGSLYGGGGGGAYANSGPVTRGGNGGRFGGGGGGGLSNNSRGGGNGGDFGGGGGQPSNDALTLVTNSAAGGFGGGGGGAHYNSFNLPGGNGGFGGGGGAGRIPERRGTSVAFGGEGGYGQFGRPGGGGGAALGGAVFVRAENGASFTCINSDLDAGSVSGGSGAQVTPGWTSFATPGSPGEAHGSAVFLLAGTNTFAVEGTNTSTISGSISGWSGAPVTFLKTGFGRLVLAGTNYYHGPTVVDAGTLHVNGILAAESAVTVGGFGKLAGTGSVGNLSIEYGGVLSPGSSVGTLYAGNTTWSGAGHYNWEMSNATGAPGSGYDLLDITGTLDLSAVAGFQINIGTLTGGSPGPALNFNRLESRSWTIVKTTGGIIGFDANDFLIVTGPNNGVGGFANHFNGGSFSLVVSSNDLLLVYAGAPPPFVDTLPASRVNWTQALLRGAINPAVGMAETYFFQFGTSTNNLNSTSVQVFANTNVPVEVKQLVNDLISGATYYFRLVVSSGGNNSFGPFESFTTPAGSPFVAGLLGANPETIACGTPWEDPGVMGTVGPLTIAARAYHSLALKRDGSVVAWGWSPGFIPSDMGRIVSFAAGAEYNLALNANGRVYGWGNNYFGERVVPATAFTNVQAVAAGNMHSIVLKTDGTVIAWGYNGSGQTNVPALSNIVGIAAGDYHSLALDADGKVHGWGNNESGRREPPLDLLNVTAIAAGYEHSLALKADGTVAAWGSDYYGQGSVPSGLQNVIAIAAGSYHNLALLSDGSVRGWGRNNLGQTNVPGSLNNVVAIAAGEEFSLALRADGSLVAWGGNSSGETNVPDVFTVDFTYGSVVTGDFNVAGTYPVVYTLTNSFGNVATVTRTLIVECAPPVQPELTGLTLLGNGALQFAFTNVAGASFTVVGTTNIVLPINEWEVIGPVIEVAPGQFSFTGPAPTGSNQFYRVRSP
jgi:hypothetical protein